MLDCKCGMSHMKVEFHLIGRCRDNKSFCAIRCPKCNYRTRDRASVSAAINEWDQRQKTVMLPNEGESDGKDS